MKKIFSLMLVLCMMFCLCSTAFAATYTQEQTVPGLSGIQPGDTLNFPENTIEASLTAVWGVRVNFIDEDGEEIASTLVAEHSSCVPPSGYEGWKLVSDTGADTEYSKEQNKVFVESGPGVIVYQATSRGEGELERFGIAKILGVTEGNKITAYRFVKGQYVGVGENKSFEKWVVCPGASISEVPTATTLTEDILHTLVQDAKAGRLGTGIDCSDGTLESEAGSYVILVDGVEEGVIYNPSIVSINLRFEETDPVVTGEVEYLFNADAKNFWMKKAPVTLTKTIVDGIKDHGDAIQNGETAEFNIAAKMPDYSIAYDNCAVSITDTMDDALTFVDGSLTVKIGDNTYEASDSTFAVNPAPHGFTLVFAHDFIIAHGAESFVVDYKATFNAASGDQNFKAHLNTATMSFDYDTTDGYQAQTISDTTRHYTFELDGNLNGNEGSDYITTYELNKVNQIVNEFTEKDGSKVVGDVALSGAVFTLKDANGTYDEKATSDTNGKLTFSGLDAGVDYTLKEKKAPKGYAINTTERNITVSANFNDDGTLAGYSVNVADGTVITYALAPAEEGSTTYVVKAVDGALDHAQILNTQVGTLPSTGGNGITLALVASGVAGLMAVAFVVLGKKKEQSQAN